MSLDEGRCDCGARFVGEPILEPDMPQPKLGAAAAALGLALLSLSAFWARPLVAVAIVAAVVGIRAVRAARRDPARHGGLRTASAGLALSVLVTLVAGGIGIARIPRYIDQRREAKAAATRAEMYRIAGLVQEYRATYGAYPERLSDLTQFDAATAPADVRDSWERRIIYSGFTSGIASASGALTLNANFELRSPGPDGLPNTPDDIIMRDGSIVDGTSEESPAPPTLPVTVPVTNRVR